MATGRNNRRRRRSRRRFGPLFKLLCVLTAAAALTDQYPGYVLALGSAGTATLLLQQAMNQARLIRWNSFSGLLIASPSGTRNCMTAWRMRHARRKAPSVRLRAAPWKGLLFQGNGNCRKTHSHYNPPIHDGSSKTHAGRFRPQPAARRGTAEPGQSQHCPPEKNRASEIIEKP